MAVIQGTPLSVSAVLLSGQAVAIVPSKPYTRVVRSMAFFNTAGGVVTVYQGTVNANKLVAKSPLGDGNTYTVPIKLPSGQGLVVVWDTPPVPVGNARVTVTWMEERN